VISRVAQGLFVLIRNRPRKYSLKVVLASVANATNDQTHFHAKGAEEMARLLMERLVVAEPSLNQTEPKH
jgi:lysophospholipase L1-like esterase